MTGGKVDSLSLNVHSLRSRGPSAPALFYHNTCTYLHIYNMDLERLKSNMMCEI